MTLKAKKIFAIVCVVLVLALALVVIPTESIEASSCSQWYSGNGDIWDGIWCSGISMVSLLYGENIEIW
jgi:hypothetical protein